MRIAVCPNTFRGSLTAFAASQAIIEGLQDSQLDCDTWAMPLADGGNGSLEVWLQATQGKRYHTQVENPLGEIISASFGIVGDIAFIEMAQASGVELLTTSQRNPAITSTYGTGQLIRAAIDHGAKHIWIGVGGSATVDGGAGCLQALGVQLLNMTGRPIERGGLGLGQLSTIDLNPALKLLEGIELSVLCDVENPLLGDTGAAPTFAPQKGADTTMVNLLVENLAHYADVVERTTDISIGYMARGGAAGGLSAGLHLVGGKLVAGFETLLQLCDYERRISQVDLIITGEGRFDLQTQHGKAPMGIAKLAQKYQIPIIALVGDLRLTPQALYELGFRGGFSIIPYPCSFVEAVENAYAWLKASATTLGNFLSITTPRKEI